MILICNSAKMTFLAGIAKCSLALTMLYLSVLISSGDALAEQNQPNILVLNSYHQGENWTDNEIAGIFSELQTHYSDLVPLVETLDTKRYPSPAHLDFLKNYLLRKYHERRIDLIIALDNPALNLIAQNSTDLFPDVPVVFAGINGFHPEMIANRKNITGVIERQDVAGTVKMALALHPKVSRILAVHDYTASGLAVRHETETALAQFAGKLKISYSADIPFDTLSEELKKMPVNGLVLILTYVTDKTGRTFTREESTRLISSLSPAPVYAMHETRLGFGIMGGLLLEGKEHGRQAARLAFRILQGEDPDRIAVEESHSRSILDYEGLRRLKIPEDLWPKDALVVNRPISFWNHHRNVLIPSIAAIIVLLGLSTMLLGAVIRLRRAEKTIHKSEEKYRVLFDSFPLGITVAGQDGKILETNAMAATLLSIPKEEHEKWKVDSAEWHIVRPDGTPMPTSEYASTRALKENCLIENLEMGIFDSEAKITWLSVTAAPLPLEGYGVVVTYTDISEHKRVVEDLRKSEERLNNLVESVGEGIILQNASERILLWNSTASEIFDLDSDQITGQPAGNREWNTIREDGSPYPVQDHPSLHTLRTGQSCSGVIMGVKKNEHETRWIKINTRPLFAYEEEKPYAVIISFSDFTERKKSEEAMRESEINFRTFFASTTDMLFVAGMDGRIFNTNEVFTETLGYNATEFSEMRVIDLYHLDRREEVETALAAMLRKEQNQCLCPLQTKTGVCIPAIFRVWRGTWNGIDCIYGTCRNRSVEAEAEQRFEQFFRHNPALMALTGGDNRQFVDVNDAWLTTLGYSRDEILGKTGTELKLFPSAEQFTKVASQLRKEERITNVEMTVRCKDGSLNYGLFSGEKIISQGQHYFLTVMIDITDRKKIEEEQKKLQSQLIQAQKMEAIGTLAGGIAHDFNNILGAILGYAEMAVDDCPADSKVTYDITQIVKAGNRARELVKQILAFSRQTETDLIPLQPGIIVAEALKLLRSSLPTTITIIQQINRDAGVVLADPTQIHQIVMNLCTNAFHAMEKDGGTLEISLEKKELTPKDLLNEPHLQPGKYVQLSIRDTGIGIAPEDQERIFDPYFTTKEVGKGTGMGLSIAHGIVQSYGGSIRCDSRLGEGTVFHIILPAVDSSNLHVSEKTAVIPGGNEHILLIDDEELLVEMGKRMLERLGYRVTSQTDSIKALATFQNQPQEFDLVITDQTMPGMTGSRLAQKMLLVRPDLPIILCTGYSNLISDEKARSLGIKGFAMKPLAKNDIAILIRNVLD